MEYSQPLFLLLINYDFFLPAKRNPLSFLNSAWKSSSRMSSKTSGTTNNIAQARRTVQQLRIEASIERIKVKHNIFSCYELCGYYSKCVLCLSSYVLKCFLKNQTSLRIALKSLENGIGSLISFA